jgi:hypothetical protein
MCKYAASHLKEAQKILALPDQELHLHQYRHEISLHNTRQLYYRAAFVATTIGLIGVN